jgi:hypothetical protein
VKRLAAFAIVLSGLSTLNAQGVIVSGASSGRYIEVRPLVLDSVPFAQTDSAWGAYRQTSSGTLVRCTTLDAYCTFFRSAQRQSLVAMMQDIDVTGWGFGEGVSVHAQLRARTAAGAARELWPQATQTFDALAAYVDVDRSFARVRAGRQWLSSTLGVFNFDGLDLSVRPASFLATQLYAGGALVEGLNRPLDAGALAPVEDLPPSDRAYLIGGSASVRRSGRGSLNLQYQRVIRADRAALYSERVGGTADLNVGPATLSGQLVRDLAMGQTNELAASVHSPLVFSFDGGFTVRHHAPYFDLWTIWGAFSPVGFDEIATDLHYAQRDGAISLTANASWRSYQDTHSGLSFAPLRSDGWHVTVAGSARLLASVRADASYGADVGFGASGTNGDAALRWSPATPFTIALRATAFQTIDEFQIGQGRVVGLGADATWEISPMLRLAADAFLYRQAIKDRPELVDWNQRRLNVRLEWSIGQGADERPWDGIIGKARGAP